MVNQSACALLIVFASAALVMSREPVSDGQCVKHPYEPRETIPAPDRMIQHTERHFFRQRAFRVRAQLRFPGVGIIISCNQSATVVMRSAIVSFYKYLTLETPPVTLRAAFGNPGAREITPPVIQIERDWPKTRSCPSL